MAFKPTGVSPDCDCTLSKNPGFGQMVDEMLALDMSFNGIENACRAKGYAIKRETVQRHLNQCLAGVRPKPNPLTVSKVAKSPIATAQEKDLARLVQAKAIEGLQDGTLKVTVKDGLSATALLDKREARMEDQKFMLGLARLLSGAGSVGPQDPHVIDVTPTNPLLAPAHLRADSGD
jgi:hypothetical protein